MASIFSLFVKMTHKWCHKIRLKKCHTWKPVPERFWVKETLIVHILSKKKKKTPGYVSKYKSLSLYVVTPCFFSSAFSLPPSSLLRKKNSIPCLTSLNKTPTCRHVINDWTHHVKNFLLGHARLVLPLRFLECDVCVDTCTFYRWLTTVL